ncbi:MAG: tyrosine-protein phosphatase [Eggerthellaceae bacterium]
MRDIHCHILPGVDDGARDLEESLDMLRAAQAAGIMSIVCTPHVRDPFFDYRGMRRAFQILCEHADGFPLQMGWEVNHAMLIDLGFEWAKRLCFQGSDEFLLELSSRSCSHHFAEYERTIFRLQSMGYQVIIAHPERVFAIQENISLAQRLVQMGCKLQASGDFISGGKGTGALTPAKKILKKGLYTYIASDAHSASGYNDFMCAMKKFDKCLHA